VSREKSKDGDLTESNDNGMCLSLTLSLSLASVSNRFKSLAGPQQLYGSP
jgi:hypothetical protein